MHKFDSSWTLFLDRDGVINQRIPNDYVKTWDQFDFIPGSIKAIEDLSNIFGRIVVVTNQAGIGKGLMTEDHLFDIHRRMLKTITLLDGRIDKIYHSPDLPSPDAYLRKPNGGMAYLAQRDFPEINFRRSVIVGDSFSDMEFGERLGMVKVFIEGKDEGYPPMNLDYCFESLFDFSKFVVETCQH